MPGGNTEMKLKLHKRKQVIPIIIRRCFFLTIRCNTLNGGIEYIVRGFPGLLQDNQKPRLRFPRDLWLLS